MAATTVAVITGGAGGMGLATAKLLGRGNLVLISDVHEERLHRARDELRRLGMDCAVALCDVADRRSVDALAARATSLGRVAAVVHTAGLSPQMGSAETILRVNALGTIHVNQTFAAQAQEGFRIVNVASSAGHLHAALPLPRRSYGLALTDPDAAVAKMLARCRFVPERLRPGLAYAMSKNFVIWLSRHLAGQFGNAGAGIVSVSPGSFDTEMGRLEADRGAAALARRSALGRFGAVDEIAEVLAFCASNRAGYLTGVDVLVDGGAQAVMTLKDAIALLRNA